MFEKYFESIAMIFCTFVAGLILGYAWAYSVLI